MDTLILLIFIGALFWAAWHWFLADWMERVGLLGYIRGRTAATKIPDEVYYEQAAAEIKAGNLREGLWAKAWAEAAGDEKSAQARYIKLRVAAMKDEVTRKFSEESGKEPQADADGNTVISCPKCSGGLRVPVGKLLDVQCPKCSHEFRVDTEGGITFLPVEDNSDQIVGRIGRLKFFAIGFANFVAAMVLNIMVKEGGAPVPFPPWNWSTTVFIAVVVIYYVLLVARVRDVGHSSWTALWGVFPGLNLIFVFYLLVKPGQITRNRYGLPNEGLFKA